VCVALAELVAAFKLLAGEFSLLLLFWKFLLCPLCIRWAAWFPGAWA